MGSWQASSVAECRFSDWKCIGNAGTATVSAVAGLLTGKSNGKTKEI